jgi:hypothetical protein
MKNKTPEEMAEEYAVITTNNLFYREPLSNAFLAGYQAAQKQERLKLADLYSHGSDVQKIASTYLKNKGIEGPLLAYAENRFIDGYQAAKEHAHATLEEAEARHEAYVLATEENFKRLEAKLDQLTNADKVMPDTCDHILDMGKMVDVNSSNNLNGWISVKDKSPEINQRVLLATNEKRSIVTGCRLPPAGKNEPWFHTDLGLWCGTETVTHWMPLPSAPKEEG